MSDTSMPTRDRAIEALRQMPPDASVDQIIERLLFIERIERGLREADTEPGIPHDEVESQMRQKIQQWQK